MDLYRDKLRQGELRADAAQEQVARAFDRLANELNSRPPARGGLLGRLIGNKPEPAPGGLYVHGEVGRGKTMLMDLFHASVTGLPKRRIHFHAFMQEVHARRNALKTGDVIARIAGDIADEARLLCLDEMQITDIADAMIIGRLFDAITARGVCFVTTSNLPPEGLYRDGLNRQLFLPFIGRLRDILDVVSLDSPHDYRVGRLKAHETFIHPDDEAAGKVFDALWDQLTDASPGEPETIDVLGRKLHVPHAAHGCARFTFNALCRSPLGPADYLALAHNYRTVFVAHIPKLSAAERNEARRFILMIDTFYDAGIRLVATAATPPEGIYPRGDHRVEFARTISRLKEMQAASWWGQSIAET